jgi:flavin reductase (DIM6/NTAB) family NADH-FMN oxidoreductase RutF
VGTLSGKNNCSSDVLGYVRKEKAEMADGKGGDTMQTRGASNQPVVTPDVLREAFRRHAEGATIITTIDEFGNVMGITATAVTAGSLDPPLLIVCIGNRSWMLGPLTAGASFIVHFLAADQEHLARQFARPGPDKFEGTSYQFARSGCPRLTGALASLECIFHASHPCGDHTIVIGRIVDVRINGDVDSALVFFGGQLISFPG